MKDENCEELNRNELPTIRITAIWGKKNLDQLPPKAICMKAAQACGHLLSMLGFTHCAIGAGSLEHCIKNSAEHDTDLLDAAKFENEAETILDGVPQPKASDKLKNVTTTVEDMLKGIDLNKTCEDK
jgi:hypothetical protein